MKSQLLKRKNSKTLYVQLDTRKCEACWKCLENCQKQVIGKIDLPWHKHAMIFAPDNCTGCLKCIKACSLNAFSKIEKENPEIEKQQKRIFDKFMINNLLLMSGVLMTLSGLILQLGFHIGGHATNQADIHEMQYTSTHYEQLREIETGKILLGFNYYDWSTIHKYAVIFFSLLITNHIYAHWKRYKGIISKHLIGRNTQVITLSVLFLLVAFTGLIPWLIDLLSVYTDSRLVFIEIHDKFALIFVIYLILHVVKRKKWFTSSFEVLKR